jgi:hypothetical protein
MPLEGRFFGFPSRWHETSLVLQAAAILGGPYTACPLPSNVLCTDVPWKGDGSRYSYSVTWVRIAKMRDRKWFGVGDSRREIAF